MAETSAEFAAGATPFATATTGAGALTAVLTTTTLAAGTIGYYRWITASDTGVLSQTEIREEGTITLTGGGGDITADVIAYPTIGTTIKLNTYADTVNG